MALTERDFELIALQLGMVFKPSTAIDQNDLFCGRTSLIRQVIDAINQTGRHAIIYGEPGVGKTSMSQILAERIVAKARPVLSPHVNCDSGDDYKSIWAKVFSEIKVRSEAKSPGFAQVTKATLSTLKQQLTEEITPDLVRRLLTQLGQSALLYVILDEFDKVPSSAVRSLIADTIKVLSDRAVAATIILVGVSDDVTGLIENHQSVERCLEQVHMPRMDYKELEQIVLKGMARSGELIATDETMTIEQEALNMITRLSKGLPHYTHLLALHAGRQACDEQSLVVHLSHVKSAISQAIQGAQESIRLNYDKATYSTKKRALYDEVLLACAMTETDEYGHILPTAVCGPLSRIMKKQYKTDQFGRHLHAFCENDRGPVLRKQGGEYRWRYRFANPHMQPYVLMKGMNDKLITESDLAVNADADGQRRLDYDRDGHEEEE